MQTRNPLRPGKWWKAASTEWLAVAALFLMALLVFSLAAHAALGGKEDEFDVKVHLFVASHSTPAFIALMQHVTFLGSASFLLPAYGVLLLLLLLQKKKRSALAVFIIGSSSFLLMSGLKQVFHRQRPELPLIKGIATYSFPSGHSLSSFIFCSLVAYLVWKSRLPVAMRALLVILLFLLAVAIGLSRIVLNVHYATDVMAGFCLGVVWVLLSFGIIRKLNDSTSQPVDK